MTGFVYKWTNLVNHKQYIGSHKGTPNDGYRHSSRALSVAEKKYGIDNFVRVILFEGDYEKDDIKAIESDYLNKYDAANNPMFYNLTNRTGTNCYSEETRAKISKANKGRLAGEKNPFYGKTHNAESRKRISEARLGKTWEEVYSKETLQKMRYNNPLKGKTYEEIYGKDRAQSRKLLGKNNPSSRQEVKDKISETWKNRKLNICPHCSKSSKNKSAMLRWHFSNCKNAKDSL